jgi:hypothetical protein
MLEPPCSKGNNMLNSKILLRAKNNPGKHAQKAGNLM